MTRALVLAAVCALAACVLQDASGEDVDCGRIADPSRLRRYEKDATRWADEVAPLTDCGTRNR